MSLLNTFVEKYGRLPTEFDPDYLEMLRMSKYRIMSVPDVQPGKCANCGSSKADGRSYCDFGLDIPWYGTVLLCGTCIQDIARQLGLFKSLEEALDEALQALLDKTTLEKQGKDLLGELNDVFREVKYYLGATGLHPSGDGDSSNSSSVLDDNAPSNREAAGESNKSSDAAKQRTAKSSSSSGPKDLLSLAERLKGSS